MNKLVCVVVYKRLVFVIVYQTIKFENLRTLENYSNEKANMTSVKALFKKIED